MDKQLIFEKIASINSKIDAIEKQSKGVHGQACRSIYDLYQYIHPLLSEEKVFMVSTVLDHAIRWTFYAEDGSNIATEVPIKVVGNTYFDSGMVISYSQKYALVSVFTIPDRMVNDLDPDTNGRHRQNRQTQPQQPQTTKAQSKRNTPAIDKARMGFKERMENASKEIKKRSETILETTNIIVLDEVVSRMCVLAKEVNLSLPDYCRANWNQLDRIIFDISKGIEYAKDDKGGADENNKQS